MKFIDGKTVKTVTKLIGRSKNTIVKHLPQIMAVAGVGCFMASTYCAVKETPKAMAKLEEKKALDPNMTGLQKAAVILPEFKGCVSFAALGLGLSFGAWKIESLRFAEMAGVAATALSDNGKLKEALREQVGGEKAQEIVDQIDEEKGIRKIREGDDADACPTAYKQVVPVCIGLTGKTFWISREKLEDRLSDCRAQLRTDGYLSMIDLYETLGAGECNLDLFWAVSKSDGFGYNETAVRDEFSWNITPYEDDFGRLGWYLEFTKDPHQLDG